jgi:hypothetical protein
MTTNHKITPDGESTAKWAIRETDFIGIKRITHCARCGLLLPFKRSDEPRHFCGVFKPYMHVICDDCFDALP